MNPQHMYNPSSHRSTRTRFAYRFLRALRKLRKQRTSTCRRYHKVKMAAYASMASAVGSKRAWSRALLWKIRNRGLSRTRTSLFKRSKSRTLRGKSKNVLEENPRKEIGELRQLVPGGEVMDLLSLFDETAHYIKCLTSQVEVMRNIVNLYSARDRS